MEGLLKVWCLAGDQKLHLSPIENWLAGRATFTYDSEADSAQLLEAQPDIVVCVNDYPCEIAQCLKAARTAGIPSLVVQDGILEWRCQYENPLFGAGGGAPQHQPVFADKIACIGNQSARQIAAWGNAEKVEVTGMPRLDALLCRPAVPRRKPGNRILILTAKNPGFTPVQTEITLRSLRDIKAYFQHRDDLVVTWRIRRELADLLAIDNKLNQFGAVELAEALDSADAVITTISTAILETMLLDRPVAALDYHNVPRFIPTAWSITAETQIETVVSELLNPPPRKMAYQRDCLDDCLRHDGPAAAKVGSLIETMSHIGRDCRKLGSPLILAGSLIEGPNHYLNGTHVDLSDLYPEQEVFQQRDLAVLQSMAARLEKKNRQLEEELKRRSLRNGIYLFGRHVAHLISSRS